MKFARLQKNTCWPAGLFLLIFGPALAAEDVRPCCRFEFSGGQYVQGLLFDNSWLAFREQGADTVDAYVLISNESERDRLLVGAQSEIAESIILSTVQHDTTAQGDGERVIIPADTGVPLPVGLRYGSIQLVLSGAREPLRMGQIVPISLLFADGAEIEIFFTPRYDSYNREPLYEREP